VGYNAAATPEKPRRRNLLWQSAGDGLAYPDLTMAIANLQLKLQTASPSQSSLM
jgi:hypothetical protein